MMQKVEVTDPGQTTFLAGEQVSRKEFRDVNQKAICRWFKTSNWASNFAWVLQKLHFKQIVLYLLLHFKKQQEFLQRHLYLEK